MTKIRILAISGSLRAQSSNSRLIQAARKVAPEGVELVIYGGVGALPHFSPDLDADSPPEKVRELRALVGSADGMLLSSPEYAHGVPGSFKNALDWLVASSEFPDMPVALIGGGEYAQAQLEETLKTMSAQLVMNRLIRGPILRAAFDDQGELKSGEVQDALQECLEQLANRCKTPRATSSGRR